MATVVQQTVTNGTNWATSNERQQIERRLALIHRDIELKRAAIKNLRLSLQQTNVSEWVAIFDFDPPISGRLLTRFFVFYFPYRFPYLTFLSIVFLTIWFRVWFAATSTRTSDKPRLNTNWREKKPICWICRMKREHYSCVSVAPFISGDETVAPSSTVQTATITSPALYSGLLGTAPHTFNLVFFFTYLSTCLFRYETLE